MNTLLNTVRSLHWLAILPLTVLIWLMAHPPAGGQIIPDATLETESSIVSPNQVIQNLPADLIQGGATRGSNLFHSFLEFNVNEGQRVYFENPTGIETILSRVTGSDISDILGTLGVNGGADLFFLNPNGIIFGANARLDIAGSFHASTAEKWEFGDGSEFSVVDPTTPPLLVVNVTPGVQFGKATNGIIQQRGQLTAGQDLQLSAGALDIQGQMGAGRHLTLDAQGNVVIRDMVLNPIILAAGQDLVVQGHALVDIFGLNHPQSGLFAGGNLTLRSANLVSGDAHFWSGGSFTVEQLDGKLGNFQSLYDPIIRSQGDVSFFYYEGTSLHILSGGSVDVNTIVITAPDVLGITPETANLAIVPLSNGETITIRGNEQTTLDIRSGVDIAVVGNPLGTSDPFRNGFFFPSTPDNNVTLPARADITIGDIVLFDANGLVLLTNQYQPRSDVSLSGDITITGDGYGYFHGIDASGSYSNFYGGSGAGSDVVMDSRGDIHVSGNIKTSAYNNYGYSISDSENPGNIKLLATGDINFEEGSSISSSGASGGNITISGNQNVTFNGAGISSVSYTPLDNQNSKDITIDAQSIHLLKGSGIISNTQGASNSSRITLKADNDILLEGLSSSGFGSQVYNLVGAAASGNAGDISIESQSLTLRDGARISSSTSGTGDASPIAIDIRDSIVLEGNDTDGFGSGILSRVGASGNAGDIEIKANDLRVSNGATIDASTLGQGNGGKITILANNSVIIEGIGSDILSISGNDSILNEDLGSLEGITIETESFILTILRTVLMWSSGVG